ncbi:cytochrome P450 [Collybia nuda]|uniref:Cytochrome P450 n=1 Tax=Collybia nuda TaxID=64659 RepID=A0A9P5Y7X4_9AGAR|nr:cytochrome P450 [Collybia nuda]
MSFIPTLDIANLIKLFALAITLLYIYHLYYQTKHWPPGPRGLPILGNIFQVPRFSWYTFTNWKVQYGSIISLNIVGQPMIILNTHKVASELLNRRSQIYSDRPRFIMAGEILSGGLNIILLSPTDRWRRMRRAGHEGFKARASEKYRPIQELEATRLVTNLINDPENWSNHFNRSAASSILCSVYGRDPIERKDDYIVEKINTMMDRLVHAAFPGAYLVEIFPRMKHLPLWMAKWKREGQEHFTKDTNMFERFLSDVGERMLTGNCKPCFASSLLDNQSKAKLTNEEASWLAGAIFGAGSETTSSVLHVFLLAMTLYPDVMRTAQTEIDGVVGPDRLPNFGDFDQLPYIQAMVKEVLRWRPVIPLGFPRCAAENDFYEGYHIPRGAIVVPNVWAMNRDPDLYPDYDEFRPGRFLNDSGGINQVFSDLAPLGHVTFGFGKRICSGLNLANQSLFINFACMLWALNIEQAIDNEGKRIVPSRTACIDRGIVAKPAPFVCNITIRSNNAIATVVEQMKADKKA